MLGRVLLRTAAPAALLLALSALVSGCSDDGDDCQGATYDVDLSEKGAATPISALDEWLAAPEGMDDQPPKDDWIVQGGGDKDATEVEILNEDTDDGWWVHVVRTDDGGYVVDQATSNWSACEDELS